jgi:mannose-1-phosphate guanylyltransferase/mannose-6-phosphate isomerase
MLIPVILSGGAGTRLWPLSRELYPKQFLPLTGERTMIQETALRAAGLPGVAEPIVVCNEAHRFLVAEQLRQVGVTPQAILLEPIGRNTAPAVAVAAFAALAAAREGEEPLLLVLPADHVIGDLGAFRAAVETALLAGQRGRFVTFGIVPTRPETGYGYIRKGLASGPALEVAAFVEKPDAAKAAQFVASGDYLWNSGMFLLPARGYLEELRRLEAPMYEACERARPRLREARQGRVPGLPCGLHRLRRHGENQPRRRRAAGCGLERHRFLCLAAGGAAGRRRGQCDARGRPC